MRSRPVRPRGRDEHEELAIEVLDRYSRETGWAPSLPVPIEHVVEAQYDLAILWEELPEEPGAVVLGALSPAERTIQLNERHLDLFEQVVGPEAFTLAHELAHWLYDVDDPGQGQLFATTPDPVFCRGPAGATDSDAVRLREINANKLAACLLLPAPLVRAGLPERARDLAQLASVWGVSRTTLRIRMEELGLAPGPPDLVLCHNATLC